VWAKASDILCGHPQLKPDGAGAAHAARPTQMGTVFELGLSSQKHTQLSMTNANSDNLWVSRLCTTPTQCYTDIQNQVTSVLLPRNVSGGT
jgi:hypothetical protein